MQLYKIALLGLLAVLVVSVACTPGAVLPGQEAAPTPDIEAIVAARVKAELTAIAPTPTATATPKPTPTATPTPPPRPTATPVPASKEFMGPNVTVRPAGVFEGGSLQRDKWRDYAKFFATAGTPVRLMVWWDGRPNFVQETDPLGDTFTYTVGDVGKGGQIQLPTRVTGWYVISLHLDRLSVFEGGYPTAFRGLLVFPGSYQAEGPFFYPD